MQQCRVVFVLMSLSLHLSSQGGGGCIKAYTKLELEWLHVPLHLSPFFWMAVLFCGFSSHPNVLLTLTSISFAVFLCVLADKHSCTCYRSLSHCFCWWTFWITGRSLNSLHPSLTIASVALSWSHHSLKICSITFMVHLCTVIAFQ